MTMTTRELIVNLLEVLFWAVVVTAIAYVVALILLTVLFP